MRQTAIELTEADHNQDHCIDFNEFRALVEARMPENPLRSDAMLRAWFDELDTDHTGVITMIEFFAYALRECFLSNNACRGESIDRFFAHYDKDGDGTLNLEEFAHLAERVGFGGLAAELLSAADIDGKGRVNKQALMRLMRRAPSASSFFAG